MGDAHRLQDRLTHSGAEAPARFAALAALFDAGTRRHLSERGLGPGWRCLEVGAGGGSIAAWLGNQVRPAGHVVATDIDTRFLDGEARDNLEVWRHDVVRDHLPEAAFDLVHTRLVLMHLPEREAILGRLAAALKPGGWLVVEEFDSLSAPPDPAISPGEALLATYVAMGLALARRGVDRRYGRLLFGRLRAIGLSSVGAEARTFMIAGASPGAALVRASAERVREEILQSGAVTARTFEADLRRLDDPAFVMPSPALWAAWGRRPLGAEVKE